MRRHHVLRGLPAVLMLIGGILAARARGEEPSLSALGVNTAAVGEEPSGSLAAPDTAHGVRHEALLASQTGAQNKEKEATAERAPKPPPPAVAEWPGVDPSRAGARWMAGYWAWDKARRDYVWVTGTWQVPPPGKFWVNGYWRRDGQGWYRVPGFWSARVDGAQERRPDWKTDGPPSPRDEEIPAPPGRDYFFVAGVYTPDDAGKGLVWKAGFWYPNHPGWEWVPAHWVHRSSGWAFRKGWWRHTDDTRELAQEESESEERSSTPVTEESSSAPIMVVPPGYPVQPRSYTPRYGYGPVWGPLQLRNRVGGFINQMLP